MITEVGIKAAVRRAPDSGKAAIELKDAGNRGEGRLALIIRPAPERVTTEWYAVWYRDGRRASAKIGNYPTLSLGDARKEFRENFLPLISSGSTPVGVRARKEKAGTTVADLFEAYLKSLGNRPASRGMRRFFFGMDGKSGAAKALGASRRACDITPDNIVPFLAAIYERGSPAMATYARAYISAAFSLAMKSEYDYSAASMSVKWGITSNPVAAIRANATSSNPGNRFLTPIEFRKFWCWLLEYEAKSSRAAAVRLVMVTGQRIGEILRISDASYDRGEALVDWSKTKNGTPHTLPLPPQATAILDGLVPDRSGLYFPRRRSVEVKASEHVRWVVGNYIKETGAEPFTARDLRRTWKTLTGAAGLSKDIRDRLQNHALGDVSSTHYDRWSYLPEKRAAMATWSDYLDWILNGDITDVRKGVAVPASMSEFRVKMKAERAAG